MEDWAEIRALHRRDGLSKREIARRLGISPGDGGSGVDFGPPAAVFPAGGGHVVHAGGAAGAGVAAGDAVDAGDGDRGANWLVGVGDESAPARAQDPPGLSAGGSGGSA